MKTPAADNLIDTIYDWGVEIVFGLPGDGINGIMEALRKRAIRSGSFKFGMEKPPHSWRAPTTAFIDLNFRERSLDRTFINIGDI
jgi:hypothetical protein